MRWGDASAVNTLEFWLWKVAPSRETKILVAAACIVLASAAVIPLVNEYGAILSEVIIFWALDIVAAVTSFEYADTHHPRRVGGQPGLYLTLFLAPAMGAWFMLRKRWPLLWTVTIRRGAHSYVASWLWLFPGVAI